MESGLFGTFYELVEMGGAELFPPDLIPQIENEGGRWALTPAAHAATPKDWCRRRSPSGTTTRCTTASATVDAAMVGDWPGYYADYCAADFARGGTLCAGPLSRRAERQIAGLWRQPHLCPDEAAAPVNPDALALLRFLTAAEQQLGGGAQRFGARAHLRHEAAFRLRRRADELARWQTLEAAIEGVVIPPKFARYPEVEEVLWKTVQAAMTGRLSIDAALAADDGTDSRDRGR